MFPFQAFEAEVKASKGLVDNRYYEYEIYIHTVYKVSLNLFKEKRIILWVLRGENSGQGIVKSNKARSLRMIRYYLYFYL